MLASFHKVFINAETRRGRGKQNQATLLIFKDFRGAFHGIFQTAAFDQDKIRTGDMLANRPGYPRAALKQGKNRPDFRVGFNVGGILGIVLDIFLAPGNQNHIIVETFHGTDGGFRCGGNTVIDALQTTVVPHFHFSQPILNQLDYTQKKVILVTCHRRENYGAPMEQIMTALRRIADDFSDVELVYPVHLSPVVQEVAHKYLDNHPRIHLIAPLAVDEMHNLMSRCHLVMTDSGGLQEEAPALGKPVLVLRRETERPEAVEAGTVKLAGVEETVIYEMAKELLTNETAYHQMAHAVNPYGDGTACIRIADAIEHYFGLREHPPVPFGT